MQRQIFIGNQEVFYNLRKSKRARHMRLTIYCDGGIVATLPERLDEGLAEKFIREKSEWILKRLKISLSRPRNRLLHRHSKKEYLENKKAAFDLVNDRLKYFNGFYNFDFGKISIRNQRTRWGSCSRKGNLNFSYKIIFLPEKFSDYIIVHELCHIKEFNHSRRFWELVAKTVPDYKGIIRELRKL
jgi:predicted metal-dependent hydrolase